MIPTDYAADITRHLAMLIEAMQKKGYAQARVGVVLSAAPEGIVVGVYLQPTEATASSRMGVEFTERTMRWTHRQIERLPDLAARRAASDTRPARVDIQVD